MLAVVVHEFAQDGMKDGGVDEVGGVVAERGVDHVVSKIVSWLWVRGVEYYRPYLSFSRMEARAHMIDG